MTAKEQGLPEWIVQAVARGWCSPENSHKVMDADLAFAIAAEVNAALASDTGERGVVVNPEIIGNPDAAAWADYFAKTHPESTISRDVMVGWFANAMMAAHDHALAKPVKITPDVLAAVAGYYHDGPVRNWDVVRAIESSIAALTQPQPVDPPESGGQGEEACKFFSDCTSQALCASVGTCKGRFVMPASIRAEIAHPPAQASGAVTEAMVEAVEGDSGVVAFAMAVPEEMVAALRRFAETSEDDESYDVPKEMMARLAIFGLVTRGRPGWYYLTDFGRAALAQGGGNER